MISNHRITTLLIIIFFLFVFNAFSQSGDVPYCQSSTAGAIVSLGVVNHNIDGTVYKPVLLMANFQKSLAKTEKKKFWLLYGEPQFNFVSYTRNDYSFNNYEFGLNLGISYQYMLTSDQIVYASLGSGPHFITAETPRQATGFIFSDNLTFGLRKKISREGKTGFELNIQYRIRHISNANLKSPNGGINNHFIGMAVSKILNGKKAASE